MATTTTTTTPTVATTNNAPKKNAEDTLPLPPLAPFSTTPLTPEQSLAAFHVPEGYHLELVASEPMITEPVVITWDGNAKMYVAQMETYTQDADGTDTKLKKSRVMLLKARPFILEARPFFLEARPFFLKARPFILEAQPFFLGFSNSFLS